MRGKLERGVSAIVIVEKEDIAKCIEIADKFSETRWDDQTRSSVEVSPEIEIKLRNGDRFTTRSVDEFYDLDNKADNPISEVLIVKGHSVSGRVAIKIGGQWSSNNGAEITVHAEPAVAQEAVQRFLKIFKKDRAVSDILPSANPQIASIIIAFFASYLIMGGAGFYKYFLSEMEGILRILFLIIFPSILFSWIISVAQSWIFGRAVLNWSDGKVRYEKSRAAINTLFWLAPLTLLLNAIDIRKFL